MLDSAKFREVCKVYFLNWTFETAFQSTGRLVSIVVSPANHHGEPLTLNCVTSPHVLIWSAVAASCALPGLMKPTSLYALNNLNEVVPFYPPGVRWMDGSINKDIPYKELSTLFNVKFFIVSQVNPHHAPFVPSQCPDSNITLALEKWLIRDMRHRYSVLAANNMVPKIFGQNISRFWLLQKYEGHVTITPPATMLDWFRMIMHPTQEDMKYFINTGQHRLWPHLSKIRHLMQIELILRECWIKLENLEK